MLEQLPDVYDIVAVPAVPPVTIPIALTVATPVLPLPHTPPAVVLLSTVVLPAHTFSVPVIAAGEVSTLTVVTVLQPLPSEYVITALPAATPVTIPFSDPINATDGPADVHTPPVGVEVSVILAPVHAVDGPLIVVGALVTFTVAVLVQPAAEVHVMMTEPVAMPFTTPVVAPIVAIEGLLLAHDAPPVPALKVAVAPAHIAVGPLITGVGFRLTITLPVIVLVQPLTVVAITV
jgi:hypothetical protein